MKDKNYGTYYGKLVKASMDNEICFFDWDERDTADLIEELLEMGVEDITFDVYEDGADNIADTMFFRTSSKTIFNLLLVKVARLRPSEFSEETPNHFRMWF
jgi:hypothetical protein